MLFALSPGLTSSYQQLKGRFPWPPVWGGGQFLNSLWLLGEALSSMCLHLITCMHTYMHLQTHPPHIHTILKLVYKIMFPYGFFSKTFYVIYLSFSSFLSSIIPLSLFIAPLTITSMPYLHHHLECYSLLFKSFVLYTSRHLISNPLLICFRRPHFNISLITTRPFL